MLAYLSIVLVNSQQTLSVLSKLLRDQGICVVSKYAAELSHGVNGPSNLSFLQWPDELLNALLQSRLLAFKLGTAVF